MSVCCYFVTYAFHSESTLYSCLNVKEHLTRTHNHLVQKRTLNHLAKLARWLKYLSILCIWLYPLYSCLNVNELLAQNRCKIWILSDCNRTGTHNHLVRKWTLNHLAKLAKWLSCVVSTYLYSAFDCMFFSCHICISDWTPFIIVQMSGNSLLETGAKSEF